MGAGDVGIFFMVIVLLIIINTLVIDTIYESRITRDTKDGIKMIIRVVSLIVFLISLELLEPENIQSARRGSARKGSRTSHHTEH